MMSIVLQSLQIILPCLDQIDVHTDSTRVWHEVPVAAESGMRPMLA